MKYLVMRTFFKPAPNCMRGFSLIEMAVVLMIVGTLLSGVLVAVSQTMESGRRTNALVQLRQVEEALYGFAQTYGRLPCPATAATAGREAPTTLTAVGGACTGAHGFVPGATLNMFGTINSDGLLLDPWGNPLRYSVSTDTAGGFAAFTSVAGMQALYDDVSTELVAGANMLRVCDTAACTNVIFANTAPAVVLSMGANWATYTSALEQANSGNGGTTLVNGSNTYRIPDNDDFVSTTYSEENFDDLLVWLSPHILFNRLISASKLP